MELYDKVLVLLFILANALAVGGFWHQMKEKSKDITPGMFQGAMGAAVVGIIITILKVVDGDEFEVKTYVWIAVFLIVAVVAFMKRAAKGTQPMAWYIVGLGAALSIGLISFNVMNALTDAAAVIGQLLGA